MRNTYQRRRVGGCAKHNRGHQQFHRKLSGRYVSAVDQCAEEKVRNFGSKYVVRLAMILLQK